MLLMLAGASVRGADLRGVVFHSASQCFAVGVPVIAVPEDDARRFTNLVALAKRTSPQDLNVSVRVSELQQEKTKLLYKKMFSETGPAERLEIDGLIATLNDSITFLEQVATNRGAALATLGKPKWPNAFARTQTNARGEFSLSNLPPAPALWIVAGPTTNKTIWLLPCLQTESSQLFLSETNQIRLP